MRLAGTQTTATEEMTSTVVAEQRLGFVTVLLRAIGLANVTVRPSP
jgi:hypothetical protein